MPYLITSHSASTVLQGRPFSMDASHPLFPQFVKALKTNNTAEICKMLDDSSRLLDSAKKIKGTGIVIKSRTIFYKGEPIDGSLTDHILKMVDEGENVKPLCLFLERCLLNPSPAAIMELYEWISSGNFTITEDGYFLAYKKVNNDFTDCRTGKMDNSPGKLVWMPRSAVNSDRNQTCESGLHFCSLNYLSQYAGGDTKVVILKVDPRDVCSIPNDYSASKGRACQYLVLGEYGAATAVQKKELFTKTVTRPGDLPKDKNGNKQKKVATSKVKALPKNTKKEKGEYYFDKTKKLYKVWDGKRWRPRKTDPSK